MKAIQAQLIQEQKDKIAEFQKDLEALTAKVHCIQDTIAKQVMEILTSPGGILPQMNKRMDLMNTSLSQAIVSSAASQLSAFEKLLNRHESTPPKRKVRREDRGMEVDDATESITLPDQDQ